MKRLLIFVASLCMGGVVLASRAPLAILSADPYRSAIVVDGTTGKVLFEKNADVPVYPASVVKLMDSLIILEMIEQGKLKLADIVHVTPEAARMGGSQVYLAAGEAFSLDEMLYALSIKSANDVAVALAIHVAGSKDKFVQLMNKRAAELGMTSTTFNSVHGLPPAAGQKPDVSTARDMATLSLELVKHPRALHYTSTQKKYFRNNTFEMLSHNRLLKDVAGCDGLKTGYFRAAGFSISATALRDGRRVIAVVMGCKVRPVRDAKTRELLEQGFMNLPEIEKPAVVELPPEIVEEPKPQKKKGSFAAGVKTFFRFIWKCLQVLFLILLSVGLVVLVLALIKRRRDRWKYKL